MSEKSVGTESFAVQEKNEFSGKKLRFAVIGCGGISEVHVQSLRSFPEVEVVAGVDINSWRLKWAEEKLGIPKLYQDWNQMLREVQPDAVTVCTPNGVHMQPCIDASNAGCHVIVEKPMAMNAGECEKMIAAAKKAGKKLASGFQFRYHPNTQMIRRFREAGQLGNILYVRCQALRRRGIPNWGVFGRKELQGGGPMIDIVVALMEMAHYAMGSPRPVAASGNTWTYLGNKPSDVLVQWPGWDWQTYNVEDLAVGQIRFENGAVLSIEASFAAHIEKDVWNFSVVGDKGGAQWDPPGVFMDQQQTMLNVTPAFLPKNVDFASLFVSKLRSFVDACLYDTPMESPAEAGLMVQKMLDGVYRSAETKREVAID